MTSKRKLIKTPYFLGDKVLLGGQSVNVDQVILGMHGVEYRVWYMSADTLQYCYVTEEKLQGKAESTRIGFLIPD